MRQQGDWRCHQVTKEEEVKEQEEYVTMSCLSQVPEQSMLAHEDGFHNLTVELSISHVYSHGCNIFLHRFCHTFHTFSSFEVGRDFSQKTY